MQKPLLTREQIMFWLHKFRGIDTTSQEQRQRLIDTFVNAIYLYDDKIAFTFNYKDGTQTITMAEITENFGSDLLSLALPKKKPWFSRYNARFQGFFCFWRVTVFAIFFIAQLENFLFSLDFIYFF